MSILTIAETASEAALALAVAVSLFRQRAAFLSSRQYHARNFGLILLLIAAALAFAYSDFGYSNLFVLIGPASAAVAGCGFFFRGMLGYRPSAEL